MHVFLFILQLFPLILSTVQTIEATAPIPKTGPAKLQLVLGVLAAIMQAEPLPLSLISPEKLTAIITALTNAAVGFYNLVGVFKKSA